MWKCGTCGGCWCRSGQPLTHTLAWEYPRTSAQAHHCKLSLLGLASLLWVLLARAGYGSPDFVMGLAFPLVLTVILVLCRALSLCVGLILSLVLLYAHVHVQCVALLLIYG